MLAPAIAVFIVVLGAQLASPSKAQPI
jgi:hypothetical protein